MALNRVHTRQRAYPGLGTSSASGCWIEEPLYNRTAAHPPGVRVGNWHEEAAAFDVAAWPTDAPCAEAGRARTAPGTGTGTGTSPRPQAAGPRRWETETRGRYQGTQPPRPRTGVRSQALALEAMRAADEAVGAGPATRHAAPPSAVWETEAQAMGRSVPPRAPPPRRPVGAPPSYLTEAAITVYHHPGGPGGGGGRPPGLPLSRPSADNPFKRNSDFTAPIGEFKKAPTPLD